MHKLTSIITIVLCWIAFFNNVTAQVTIGTGDRPEKAGLLELKSKSATTPTNPLDDKNETSDKGGLVLPRVKLEHIKKLLPFLAEAQTTSSDKITHAGLMVYNINDTFTTATDPDKVFKQGIYVWDGARWSMLVREEFKFFHMPTFNIDTSEEGEFSIDLYDMYKKHFARTGTPPTGFPELIKNPSSVGNIVPIFEQNELNYFITNYDQSVIKSISVDNKGVMKYIIELNPPFNTFSYVNIVLVVK